MHLHGHLKECSLDFGPVHAFWRFSFERLNGILEFYHTNGHDIPIQPMRRLFATSDFDQHEWPKEFRPTFSPFLFPHKGYLVAMSLDQCLACEKEIEALPPMFESSWESHQNSLHSVVATASFEL